jgi:hypothetical protein
VAEHFLGKEEVTSSILVMGSIVNLTSPKEEAPWPRQNSSATSLT